MAQLQIESPSPDRVRIFNELLKARDGWVDENKDCYRDDIVQTSSKDTSESSSIGDKKTVKRTGLTVFVSLADTQRDGIAITIVYKVSKSRLRTSFETLMILGLKQSIQRRGSQR